MTAGWHYLLPPLADRSVLCLSANPRLGAELAVLCGELTLLCDSRIQGLPGPEQSLDLPAGASAPRVLGLEGDLQAHRQRFDGLLIHDPEGELFHRGNQSRLLELLREAVDLLRPGGFVYLGIRNAWALPPRRRERPSARGRPLSVSRLRRELRALGLGEPRVNPYLLSDGWLSEVICASGYRARRNRDRLAERAKEVVYGRLGARAFAAAYGLLCFAGPAAASTLDLLADAIAGAPFWRGAARPMPESYLLFAGTKAIVTFGSEADDNQGVVAVLCCDRLSIERRQVEAAALTRLSHLPPPLARLVPKFLDCVEVGRTRCFLITRLAGVTIDFESAVLDEISERALEFAIDLHRASSRPTRIDEAQYLTLFGALIDAAVARNPWLEADLQAWDEPLRANVVGTVLPTVWMHGDYKIENIMYDRPTRKLTGVIDWELARLPGLPLLDPLYLLIYNRSIRGEEWVEAMRSVLLARRRSAAEQASIRRYMQALGLPDSLDATLCAMYLAHAIGCRIHMRDNPQDRQRIGRFVQELGGLLAPRTSHAPAA